MTADTFHSFTLDKGGHHPRPAAPYPLMLCAQRGLTLKPLIADRLSRLEKQPSDPALLMDLSLALLLYGRRDEALAYQRCALQLARCYEDPAWQPDALRLLCLMAPGDLRANMPIELLVHDRPVTLLKLFLVPGEDPPRRLPDHDLAIVAVSEDDGTNATLRMLSDLVDHWPRPIVNDPRHILRLGRDTMSDLLADIPGLICPPTRRHAAIDPHSFSPDAFPLLIRPVGSHAGQGLAHVADRDQLAAYLAKETDRDYYVAPFIDYRSPDGQYRKYRVALIDGRAFPCHMAIADQWMLHYMNAGMDQDAGKRAEEQRFMERFDEEFGHRHRAVLSAISERVGLDVLTIDCAEDGAGNLVFFEADHAGAIHDLDPTDIYPYKQAPMGRALDAFHAMLVKAASGSK